MMSNYLSACNPAVNERERNSVNQNNLACQLFKETLSNVTSCK